MPSKEIRNRVHRTMRVNMRVGKRFGDSEYDDEGKRIKLLLLCFFLMWALSLLIFKPSIYQNYIETVP